jgi:hypothetical protein
VSRVLFLAATWDLHVNVQTSLQTQCVQNQCLNLSLKTWIFWDPPPQWIAAQSPSHPGYSLQFPSSLLSHRTGQSLPLLPEPRSEFCLPCMEHYRNQLVSQFCSLPRLGPHKELRWHFETSTQSMAFFAWWLHISEWKPIYFLLPSPSEPYLYSPSSIWHSGFCFSAYSLPPHFSEVPSGQGQFFQSLVPGTDTCWLNDWETSPTLSMRVDLK